MGKTADIIFTGGDIVTMNDRAPSAEALAVAGGRILAVGSRSDVEKLAGPGTRWIDLGGKALLPGFIDGHSHFFQVAQTADYVNVSAPPVGTASCIADVVALLKQRAASTALKAGEWLIGYGYDRDALSDGREMTRHDLDPDFPDNPVVLVHVSGHGGTLNSKALEAVHIDAATPTPAGGVIVREADGKTPEGLLMEAAWLPILFSLPKPSPEQLIAKVGKAVGTYASNGITTAHDAPLEQGVRELYERAAGMGLLKIDLVGYVSDHDLPSVIESGFRFGEDYKNHFRVAGVKSIIDGSPQGRTAFFSEPFLTGGPGGEQNYRGECMVPPDALNATVKLAYAHGAQVLGHTNGDAAIDILLEAHEAAGAPAGKRTVSIHSQFVRRDQLDKYARYGFVASFFTNHAYFWGDVHVRNLGEERAAFLSPMKTAASLGIHMANHSDCLVTPLDPLFILWTSVNRTTRSGKVLGPNERVTAYDGLKALTIDGAYMYFEEETKGSLEPGKLADLVVLDKNPVKIPADDIKHIKVVETFKEGASVYSAS